MALLERDAYLSDLQTSLDRAIDGHGRLVFLGGEAGIGKSSLIARFVQEAAPRARAVILSCDGVGLPGPLGPLFDLAAALGPEVQRLLAEQAAREAIFRAVLQAFRALDRPLIIAGDDAHWTDEATLELVRFLGRRVGDTKVLFIVAYRDDELGPYHPLRRVLGDLTNAPAVGRIHLPPLSLAAVAALAKAAGNDPGALHARTGGNPFFVTEIIESGAPGVPATVRDAVLARAARLSREGRLTIDAAAVCGPAIDPPLLAAIVGGPIEDTIEEGLAIGMLRQEDGAVRFRHAIIRDAVLSSMSLPRRHALHRRVLDALQRDTRATADFARLAYHAEEATDLDATLTYATAAARQAAAFGAHREAAAQYGRALRHAAHLPASEILPLMEARSYECYLTGDLNEAIRVRHEVVDRCEAAGDRRRQGDAMRWLSRFYWFSGQTALAHQYADEAYALLAPLQRGPELAMACSNLAQLHMLQRDLPAAIDWGERAIALATDLADDAILTHALTNVGSARHMLGDESGRQMLERAVALGRSTGLEDDVVRAMTNLAWTAWLQRDLDLAESSFAEGIAFAAEHDLVAMELYQRATLASVYLCRGDWRAAREKAELIVGSPAAVAATRIVALTCLGRIQSLLHEDATATFAEANALARQTGELQRLGPVTAGRAEAAWLSGNLSSVEDDIASAYEEAAARGDVWMAGELGLWLHRAGRPVETAGLAEPFALEIAGQAAAASGRWHELGYPLESARARASSGSEDDLRCALEAFERMGARADALLVARLLREMGARGIPRGPRPATRANAANLTARELEVLHLLAQGASDRVIADRLFLSPKTVGNHVSSILAKLDVASRTVAVRQAEALGLLQDRDARSPI